MMKDRFVAVLEKHFPDADIPEWEEYFTNDFLDDDTDQGVVDVQAQERALKDFQKALSLLEGSYLRMHRDVKKELSDQFRANERGRARYAPGFSLCGKNGEMRAEHLINHIRSLVISSTGKVLPSEERAFKSLNLPDQPSAIKAASDKINAMRRLTGKAANSETWSKIAAVERTIRCWDRYGDAEVKINSKAFLSLLQDLVDLLEGGRNWDAADLVANYRRRANLS